LARRDITPITRINTEAAFLLALPLLTLPAFAFRLMPG
jgi:hypothetical protein